MASARYPAAYKSDRSEGRGGLSRPKPSPIARLVRVVTGIDLGPLGTDVHPSEKIPGFDGGGGSFGGGGAGGSWDPAPQGTGWPRPEFTVWNPCSAGQQWYNSGYEYRLCSGVADGPGGWFNNHTLNMHSGPPITFGNGSHPCGDLNLNTGAFSQPSNSSLIWGRNVKPGGAVGPYVWRESFRAYLNKPQGVWRQCGPVVMPGDGSQGKGKRFPDPQWKTAVADPGTQPSEEEQDDTPRETDTSSTDRVTIITIPPVRPGSPLEPTVDRRPPRPARRWLVGKNQKERKASAKSMLGPIWVALNVVTEIEDVIKALHKALPKECRERPWRPSGTRTQAAHMLDNLYRCWPDIDIGQAIENLVNEQIEDWYYGLLIGQPGGAINRGVGATTGGTRLVGNLIGDHLPPSPTVRDIAERLQPVSREALENPELLWLHIPG